MLLIRNFQVTVAGLASVICFLYLPLPLIGQEANTAQPDPLDYVQSISAMTGRPIFAVAGQST
ncbi:MAG: hypothetical protein MK108_16355 [Mariniblastus sp.]|nr:hypothetical protein [Mariniblastus sp.]